MISLNSFSSSTQGRVESEAKRVGDGGMSLHASMEVPFSSKTSFSVQGRRRNEVENQIWCIYKLALSDSRERLSGVR